MNNKLPRRFFPIFLGLSACASPLRVDDYPNRLIGGTYKVTELDYIGWGLAEARAAGEHRLFGGFFSGTEVAPQFTRGVARVGAWVGADKGGEAFTISSGSGLVYRMGDKVALLTAHHVVLGEGSAQPRVFATTVSGLRSEMEPDGLHAEGGLPGLDIEILESRPGTELAYLEAASRLEPRIRGPIVGEPVLIVGYPGGDTGIAPDGSVSLSPPQLAAPLRPLFTFGTVVSVSPFRIVFIHGMVATGGMSGSPVWGVDGALLGVYTKTHRSKDRGSALIEGGVELLGGLGRFAYIDAGNQRAWDSGDLSEDEDSSSISRRDYLANGIFGVSKYLADIRTRDAGWMSSAIALANENVGVVERRTELPGGSWGRSSYESVDGTGFALGAGTVLTAGHVVSPSPSSASTTFYCGGRAVGVHVQHVEFDAPDRDHPDLAVLTVDEEIGGGGLDTARPLLGEQVLLAGYPGGIGVSDGGEFAYASSNSGAVKPILLIARVINVDPLRMELVAGAHPRGGMSGAPVINAAGECVGVLSGTGVTISGKYGGSSVILATAMEE